MTNPNEAKVIVQYPYRAVICGEEHIVKGWRSGNLITDKSEFVFSLLHGDDSIYSTRLLEVATLQRDRNGEWLLNGHNLNALQFFLPGGNRFYDITNDEDMRVYKDEIRAVAWIQTDGEGNITDLLDTILYFWKTAARDIKNAAYVYSIKEDTKASAIVKLVSRLAVGLSSLGKSPLRSNPIWLTKFHSVANNNFDPVVVKIVPAQPANVPVEAVEPAKKRATKARQPKPVAKFEDDFSIAVIPKKDGTEDLLTIEKELRDLITKIIAAGGRQPRTKLRSGKLDTYQPEKLLKSKIAKSLIKARLLGTSKYGRTTVFWAKQHTG
ncbi:MAG TPA: hypothetical protein VMD27_07100 [Candidatus Aquilonibacter sp.]|nr:hypothetical protein [Candidatus Aquilonibacter sp.]